MSSIKDLSKLDCAIIAKALVDVWNNNIQISLNNNYQNQESNENRKNKYIKVFINILIEIVQSSKTSNVLINYISDITNYLNDFLFAFKNPNNIYNIEQVDNLDINNLPEIFHVYFINFNYKLYDATTTFFKNYFDLDTDEREFRKNKYITILNNILTKNKICNLDTFTIKKAITSYKKITINDINININININNIIKFISSKMYISDIESLCLINNIFINNYDDNMENYRINYVLFYEIINTLLPP